MKLDMLTIKKSIIFIIRVLFEMQIIDPDQLSPKKTPQTMYSQSLLLSIRRLQLKISLRTVC